MIVVFQHHPLEIPARLGDALRDAGHRLKVIELYEGEQVPVDLDDVHGVVTMGGPMNVTDTSEHPWIKPELEFIKQAHDAKLPIVGVCLGAQLIATALGGEVGKMDEPEIGWGEVSLSPWDGRMEVVIAGTPWHTQQMHLHSYEVTTPPAGTVLLASSAKCKHQLFKVGNSTFAFQYHFEWDRQTLMRILDDADNVAYMQQHGVDPASIQAEIESHYAKYRHFGDRMCQRLTDLVFPLDHRLDHKSGTLTSFDPAMS